LLVIHCHGAVGNYLGFQVAMGLYLEAHGGAGAPVLAALGVAAAVLRARAVGLDAGAPRAAPLHGRAAAVPARAVVREVFPGRREALEAAAAGEGPPAFALVNATHVVELGEGDLLRDIPGGDDGHGRDVHLEVGAVVVRGLAVALAHADDEVSGLDADEAENSVLGVEELGESGDERPSPFSGFPVGSPFSRPMTCSRKSCSRHAWRSQWMMARTFPPQWK